MERGAIGELIPKNGQSGDLVWFTWVDDDGHTVTAVGLADGAQPEVTDRFFAEFHGPDAIRLERVALCLTTEQS